VIIALPSTPIFGGTKHWFTAYPFMVLFAGAAFERLRAGLAVSALAGSVLLLPSFVETAHSHPFGLSHYGMAAGGVPGAADLGMNRQFWGFTTGSLVDYFKAQMPKGGSVYICDTTGMAFQMLVRDGLLPANIRPTGDIAFADYAIVHHEKHFFDVEAQIWSLYGTSAPVHVLRYDGVPIISVYKNPRASASR
jgi:hypothetical protein